MGMGGPGWVEAWVGRCPWQRKSIESGAGWISPSAPSRIVLSSQKSAAEPDAARAEPRPARPITASASMRAITLSRPPQRRHRAISMAKTRCKRFVSASPRSSPGSLTPENAGLSPAEALSPFANRFRYLYAGTSLPRRSWSKDRLSMAGHDSCFGELRVLAMGVFREHRGRQACATQLS
jgi:hypothetical protein